MRAAWGTYRLTPEEITLGGGVSGIWRGDSARCLTARVVSADSSIDLIGRVFLKRQNGSELTCSRLTYEERSGRALLRGPVALRDSTGMYRAQADTGWYSRDANELRMARRCTLFIHVPESAPIEVTSDSTAMTRSGERVTAWGSVDILGEDVKGSCHSLTFLRDEDRVVLSGSPSLEGRGIRCRAARIVLQRWEGTLRQIVLENDAWAARTPDALPDSLSDEAWGDRMVVWLTAGAPSRLIVTGTAKARHRVVDRGGVDQGINDAQGDSILLGMGQGALTDVRVAGSARGTYTPRASGSELPGEKLDYSAHTLAYAEDAGVLVMDGAVELTSGSARLIADMVKYSPTAHDMVAQGNAVLRDGAQEIKGEVMTFDVGRRQGVVREGSTKFEEAFSLGRRVARIDSRRMDIADGLFTSCEDHPPHFYITSPMMRVELDNKVVARSLVLWIHDVPVLYLPYWIFPIRRDRHSGLLMPSFSVRNILGLEGSRASITGLGYYFVLGDYADAEITLDWNEGLGWKVNSLMDYALRYHIPSGSLRTSFARRSNLTQWEIHESHQQNLPYGWRLTANINATRSKEFIDQETWDAEDRLDLQAGLNSDITLAKTLAGWSVRTSLRRDQRWETTAIGDSSFTRQTITSSLPEIALSRPSKRILSAGPDVPWYKEIYASLSTSFRNRTVHSDAPGSRDRVATGTVHTVQLTWQLPRAFHRFNVSPRATYNETWIHRGVVPEDGPRLVNDRYGVLHSIGVSASTKLYGLWRPPIPGIEAFRHVVSPQVSFGYTPDWFLRGWDFSTGHFSAGDAEPYVASELASAYSKSRRLSMSLGNVFQVKLRRGETTIKNDNLANLNFATGYDLEKRDEGEDPWSPLSSSLTLSPGKGFSWSLSSTHDPNRSWEFVSATSTITARVDGGWNRPPCEGHDGDGFESFRGTWGISATHSYSHQRGQSDEPQTLRLDLRLMPTKGWNVMAWVNYDIANRRTMNKSLTLVRDLHCWQAEFTWYQAASQWHYLFRVFVKAYPQSLFVKHEERG